MNTIEQQKSTNIDLSSETPKCVLEGSEEQNGNIFLNLNETVQINDDEQEMQGPLSSENSSSERMGSQQSDLSALSWNLGWYECMIALEDKVRFRSFPKEDNQEEIPEELSNSYYLNTEEIDKEDTTVAQNLAFHQLQKHMEVFQDQVIEYQELMQKLGVCMKRNTSLEVEVPALRASYDKQCQNLVEKISQRLVRMEQLTQRCDIIEKEIIDLKLKLARKFTDDDSVQCTMEKMIIEVDKLKNEQKPHCLLDVKKSIQIFCDQLIQRDLHMHVENTDSTIQKKNSPTRCNYAALSA